MKAAHPERAPSKPDQAPPVGMAWSDIVQSAGQSWIAAFDQSAKAICSMAAAQSKLVGERMGAGAGAAISPALGQTVLDTELLAVERQAERVERAGEVLLQISGLAPDLKDFQPLPD